ncbi:MAG: hypothetical protein B6D77_03625 [gamma proteobacterium symbiont of Ctena orbiculata]|nr:MAG: hypothetical protein B6D77_03625 [gamma proteobacterium symbiont of Ctena orbiculata]
MLLGANTPWNRVRFTLGFGTSAASVLEMKARLSNYDVAFDASQDEDDDSHFVSLSAYLGDQSDDPKVKLEKEDWQGQQLQTLNDSLQQHDDRSRDILMSRWLNEDNKATLHELADKYQVSAERIRQLEKNAMKKIRVSLEA